MESIELFSSTREHARRIYDMLQRQETELAAADSVDPVVRQAGLRAIRSVMAAAEQLANHADVAVQRGIPALRDSTTEISGG